LESHLRTNQLHKLSTNLSPERVKYFRKDNGWSQELLAKASGLSLRTIQRAEKDGNSSVETQLALSAAFGISPKELSPISPSIDVNWKRKNIMQNFLALFVVSGAIVMLAAIAGQITWFLDYISAIFLLLFMYSCTIISFGTQGLIKSIKGFSYLFAQDISPTPASQYLGLILRKQIVFLYAGALIAILVGCIAIHSNYPFIKATSQPNLMIHRAYAVNILILLYAAIFAESILRPLTAKLESRELTFPK
jgi:transcriptional regulator with XRE-family HTH domain